MIVLGPRLAAACMALQVLPVPGLGAIIAGRRNPHTTLLRNGVLQVVLVVLGSWPLIVPGVIGLVWAVADALRIHREARPPGPLSRPAPGHDPTGGR